MARLNNLNPIGRTEYTMEEKTMEEKTHTLGAILSGKVFFNVTMGKYQTAENPDKIALDAVKNWVRKQHDLNLTIGETSFALDVWISAEEYLP